MCGGVLCSNPSSKNCFNIWKFKYGPLCSVKCVNIPRCTGIYIYQCRLFCSIYNIMLDFLWLTNLNTTPRIIILNPCNLSSNFAVIRFVWILARCIRVIKAICMNLHCQSLMQIKSKQAFAFSDGIRTNPQIQNSIP